MTRVAERGAIALAAVAVLLLALPVVGLGIRTSPADLAHALALPSTRAALWLSLRTTAISMACIVTLGLPLAWWLSRPSTRLRRVVAGLVELPIVLPPAVLGVALLEVFGRQGLVGAWLAPFGVSLSLTTAAVVLAQTAVGLPLFALAASAAFRAVDPDLLLIARTLGAGPIRAVATVALPLAAPGLVSAAALGWARALGEFGATLMFAGSLPGSTQTLPLAIYAALKPDLSEARALSLVLVVIAVLLLGGLRLCGRESALAA